MKMQTEFCKILIHSGPVLPNGNIKELGTEPLFCSGKYILAISMMEEQQINRKIFFILVDK